MAKSKQQKNALKYLFSSASIIISMFDLHTVHLKCFCSFMCPLNVFQTYIKNFNQKLFPRGQHTDGRTDGRTDRRKAHPLCLASPPGRDKKSRGIVIYIRGTRYCSQMSLQNLKNENSAKSLS